MDTACPGTRASVIQPQVPYRAIAGFSDTCHMLRGKECKGTSRWHASVTHTSSALLSSAQTTPVRSAGRGPTSRACQGSWEHVLLAHTQPPDGGFPVTSCWQACLRTATPQQGHTSPWHIVLTPAST